MPKKQNEMMEERRKSQQFNAAPEQEYRERRAQSMPAQQRFLRNEEQNAQGMQNAQNVQAPLLIQHAQRQLEEYVPEQPMNVQAMKSATETYRDIHAGQRMGTKDRFKHSDRAARRKRARVSTLNDSVARYEAQEQALQRQYSRENHPEIAGNEELAAAVMKWMVHSDNGAAQAENARRFRAAMGTREQREQEIKKIFDAFIAQDMTGLQSLTDEDIAANYDKLRDLAEKGQAISNLLDYVDAQGIEIKDNDRYQLQARMDVCRAAAEALESKRALMNNPYYAVMLASDVASLSTDELFNRAETAERRGDMQMADYLRRVRTERLRKDEGDVLKAPQTFLRDRIAARRHELNQLRDEQARPIVEAYNTHDVAGRVQMLHKLCTKAVYGTGANKMSVSEREAYVRIQEMEATDEFVAEMFQRQLELARELIALRAALPGDMSEEERSLRAGQSLAASEFNSFSQLLTDMGMVQEEFLFKFQALVDSASMAQIDLLGGARAITDAAEGYSSEWVKKHRQEAQQITEEGKQELERYVAGLQHFDEMRRAENAEEPVQEELQEQQEEVVNLRDLFEEREARPEADETAVNDFTFEKVDFCNRVLDSMHRLEEKRAVAKSAGPEEEFSYRRQIVEFLDFSGTEKAFRKNQRMLNIMSAGTIQEKRRLLNDIINDFTRQDFSILKGETDEELMENYEAKKRLLSQGMEIRTLLRYADSIGAEIPLFIVLDAKARADVCEDFSKLFGAKEMQIASGYYTNPGAAELEGLDDTQLSEIITEAHEEGDLEKSEYALGLLREYGARVAGELSDLPISKQIEIAREQNKQRYYKEREENKKQPFEQFPQDKQDKDATRIADVDMNAVEHKKSEYQRNAFTSMLRSMCEKDVKRIENAPEGTYHPVFVEAIQALNVFAHTSDLRTNIQVQADAMMEARRLLNSTLQTDILSTEERDTATDYLNYLRFLSDGTLQFDKNAPGMNLHTDYSQNESDVMNYSDWKDCSDQPIFTHIPSLNDIKQGGAGDCYFVSDLSELAQQSPEKIMNMFHDNGDGTVTVRLYERTTGSKWIRRVKELPQAAQDFLNRTDLSAMSDAELMHRLLFAYASSQKDTRDNMLDMVVEEKASIKTLRSPKVIEAKQELARIRAEILKDQPEIHEKERQMAENRVIIDQLLKQLSVAPPEQNKPITLQVEAAYDRDTELQGELRTLRKKHDEMLKKAKQGVNLAIMQSGGLNKDRINGLMGYKEWMIEDRVVNSFWHYKALGERLAGDRRFAAAIAAMRSGASMEEAMRSAVGAIADLSEGELDNVMELHKNAYRDLELAAQGNGLRARYITMKKSVRSDNRKAKDCLWVQLLEKAYALSGEHEDLEENYNDSTDQFKEEEIQKVYAELKKKVLDEKIASGEIKVDESNPNLTYKNLLTVGPIKKEAKRRLKHTQEWIIHGGRSSESLEVLTGVPGNFIATLTKSGKDFARDETLWKKYMEGLVAGVDASEKRFTTQEDLAELGIALEKSNVVKSTIKMESFIRELRNEIVKRTYKRHHLFVEKYSSRSVTIEDLQEALTDLSKWASQGLKTDMKEKCAAFLKKQAKDVTEDDMTEFLAQLNEHIELGCEAEYDKRQGGFEHRTIMGRHAAGSEARRVKYTARAKRLFTRIQELIKEGPVECGTKKYRPDSIWLQAGFSGEGNAQGVAECHAYSVVNCFQDDKGVCYVTVRNPWAEQSMVYEDVYHKDGTIERVAREVSEEEGDHEGIYNIELNDFMSRVDSVYFNSYSAEEGGRGEYA